MSKRASRELEADLRAIGLTHDLRRSLLLLPLVQVAWRASRPRSSQVRQVAHSACRQLGLDDECCSVVESWLETRPPREIFARGYRVLRRLALTPDEVLIEHEDLVRSLLFAEAVAELDRDPEWDLPTTSPQSAANALGVDVGGPWSDVALGLDAQPPACAPIRPPQNGRRHARLDYAVAPRRARLASR